MTATAANKTRVRTQLATIIPTAGPTTWRPCALAMALKPEVIFFLTDADLMTNGDVNEILTEVGTARLQAVEFGRGPPWPSGLPCIAWPTLPAAPTSTSTSPASPGPSGDSEQAPQDRPHGESSVATIGPAIPRARPQDVQARMVASDPRLGP